VPSPKVDHSKPVDVNIAALTPQVVHYRLWRRDNANAPWVICGGGPVPGHAQLAAIPAGGDVDYWFGIGGNPNDPYSVVMTFAHGGKTVPDGVVHENGTTDANGFARVEGKVSFP